MTETNIKRERERTEEVMLMPMGPTTIIEICNLVHFDSRVR